MKPILIIKNVTAEGAGMCEEILQSRQIAYEIIDLEKAQLFPAPENYSAVIVCGGPDSANDETPKIQEELSRIKEILALKIPYLGICLGLQTLVKAAGGRVMESPIKEIGFRDPENNNFTIELTPAGQDDPLFAGLNNNFPVFQLHGETVELTPDITLLGTGKFCPNQIVHVAPGQYGLQCHFELTKEMFELWLQEDPDLKLLDPVQVRADYEAIKEKYEKVGRRLFENFLEIVGI